MEMHTPDAEICGTCNHWSGARVLDELQYVYFAPGAKGICALSGDAHLHDTPCKALDGARWQRDISNRPWLAVVNCWEYTGCGLEKGGKNAATHGICPAYPDHGRTCATLAKTLCHIEHNVVKGGLPIPRERNCAQCGFNNNVLQD